ncbi:hypothetical protein ACC713_33285 [Rhizobium johnstonii]|uniref:hypothetical protein n=1 Tax=Rhizobium TaxID=379 RepID=UPI003D7C23D6
MRYFLFSLATRWGRSEGGINVFNKDLISAIADSMSTEAKCICLTKSGSDVSDKKDVEVVQYRHFDSPLETAEQIRDLIQRDASSQITQIIILGHDVHTGGLAINTCHELRKLVRFDTKSAIVRHMHYHQYAQYKGTPPPEAILRAEKQTRLVEEADNRRNTSLGGTSPR